MVALSAADAELLKGTGGASVQIVQPRSGLEARRDESAKTMGEVDPRCSIEYPARAPAQRLSRRGEPTALVAADGTALVKAGQTR